MKMSERHQETCELCQVSPTIKRYHIIAADLHYYKRDRRLYLCFFCWKGLLDKGVKMEVIE